MKLKGLAETIKQVEDLQQLVTDKIDDLYEEPPQWEEKSTFLEDAWTELDIALTALTEVRDMKLETYL
jgi:hypothetical protein